MEEYIEEVYYKPLSDKNVAYRGLLFLDGKFEKYISTRVKNKFVDPEWTSLLIQEAKLALEETGFVTDTLIEIFKSKEIENNWRIGEYVAECVLEDYFPAKFYFNNARDAKNPNANDTGADLVGIWNFDKESMFLFGEVKTSSDKSKPPQVLYGKSGMIYQLETLRDKVEKRNDLVKWIWGKAVTTNGKFKEHCIEALRNYQLSNCNKVKLIGILVRDTEVSEMDVKNRAMAMKNNIPNGMDIELIRIYSGYQMDNNNWINALNRSD